MGSTYRIMLIIIIENNRLKLHMARSCVCVFVCLKCMIKQQKMEGTVIGDGRYYTTDIRK